jgi:hypothetical protein
MKTAIALLWLWIFAVFAAHLGAGAGAPSAFFYDGSAPSSSEDIGAFAVATFASFTRSYLLAAYIANVGALMLLVAVALKVAQRRALPLLPTALALAALIATPVVAQQIAQPSAVLAATAVNCLALLAALEIGDDYGLLLALVLVNQSFIFAVALLLLVRRPIALIAAAAWLWLLHWRPDVSEWVRQPWSDFFHHPLGNALIPFVSAHIGLHVALLELLAVAGWPLLLVSAAALWASRNDLPRDRRTMAVAVLAAAFVLQQLVIGPFDTPNDPRRALPALVAIGIAWCWAAARLWPRRAWRVAVVAVLAVCAFAAFADILLKNGAIAYTATAQSIEANPKEPVTLMEKRVTFDRQLDWHKVDCARVHDAPRFVIAQLFMAFFVCALLWRLSRAQLLPRYAPLVAAILWLASAVRFL